VFVHEANSFCIVIDFLNANDGSKTFVAHEGHAVVHVVKYRGFKPIAFAAHGGLYCVAHPANNERLWLWHRQFDLPKLSVEVRV
jgi:hypothetical protein